MLIAEERKECVIGLEGMVNEFELIFKTCKAVQLTLPRPPVKRKDNARRHGRSCIVAGLQE